MSSMRGNSATRATVKWANLISLESPRLRRSLYFYTSPRNIERAYSVLHSTQTNRATPLRPQNQQVWVAHTNNPTICSAI